VIYQQVERQKGSY